MVRYDQGRIAERRIQANRSRHEGGNSQRQGRREDLDRSLRLVTNPNFTPSRESDANHDATSNALTSAIQPTRQSAGHSQAERGYPMTDLGNAERLVARHGDNIRYAHDLSAWSIWNQQRWVRDGTEE